MKFTVHNRIFCEGHGVASYYAIDLLSAEFPEPRDGHKDNFFRVYLSAEEGRNFEIGTVVTLLHLGALN